MTRYGVAILIIGLHVAASSDTAAQARIPRPDAGESGPNRISLSVGYLGASLSWSTQRTENVAVGLAVSGGAQTGFMFPHGDVIGDHTLPGFAELLSGSAFVRRDLGRVEIEGGPRVAWMYHFPTEYETIFIGVATDFRYRIRAVRLGPRVYWGRIEEEGGRSQFGFAIVPLMMTLAWSF